MWWFRCRSSLAAVTVGETTWASFYLFRINLCEISQRFSLRQRIWERQMYAAVKADGAVVLHRLHTLVRLGPFCSVGVQHAQQSQRDLSLMMVRKGDISILAASFRWVKYCNLPRING